MARILVSAAEVDITAGVANSTTVNNARFVRIYNNSGSVATLYVHDAGYTGIGSVSIKDGAVEVIEKHQEDTIYFDGSGKIKAARIGITA